MPETDREMEDRIEREILDQIDFDEVEKELAVERPFDLFNEARLKHDIVAANSHTYPRGFIGQIVHVHDGGIGFEIELTGPDWVQTVMADDLEKV